MADLWDYFKNLFKKASESTPSNPLVHEVIERSEEEKADFLHWKETLVRRRLQAWLSDQYAIFQVLPEDIDESLDFLNTPSSKGFVIYFHQTQYSKRDTLHFLDFLKGQVLQLDYRVQISDRRSYQRSNWVETVERHYLKPKPDFSDPDKFDQQYGNITILLEMRNDQPHQLKLQATVYQDSKYQEGKDFKELMQRLLL